jgi:hypothetical protein
MSSDAGIPSVIVAAGEAAATAYRAFFDDQSRSLATRKLYGQRAAAFFRWAESRGLTLEAIDGPALAVYGDQIAAERSRHEASVYLTPVRGVLRHLASWGIEGADPCPRGQPNGRRRHGPGFAEPMIPLAELRAIVRGLENWEEDSEFFQAGVVLLAPLSIKTVEPASIAAFCGVPEPLVRQFATRLLANRVWQPDGSIAVAGREPESGESLPLDLEVIIDVLIATGHVERRTATEDDGSAVEKYYPTARPLTSGDGSADEESSDAR